MWAFRETVASFLDKEARTHKGVYSVDYGQVLLTFPAWPFASELNLGKQHNLSKFYSSLFKNGNNYGYATYIPEKKSRIKGGNMNTGFRKTQDI